MKPAAAVLLPLKVAFLAMLLPTAAIGVWSVVRDSLFLYQLTIGVATITAVAQASCSTLAILKLVRQPQLASAGNVGLLAVVLLFAAGLAVWATFLVRNLGA